MVGKQKPKQKLREQPLFLLNIWITSYSLNAIRFTTGYYPPQMQESFPHSADQLPLPRETFSRHLTSSSPAGTLHWIFTCIRYCCLNPLQTLNKYYHPVVKKVLIFCDSGFTRYQSFCWHKGLLGTLSTNLLSVKILSDGDDLWRLITISWVS